MHMYSTLYLALHSHAGVYWVEFCFTCRFNLRENEHMHIIFSISTTAYTHVINSTYIADFSDMTMYFHVAIKLFTLPS